MDDTILQKVLGVDFSTYPFNCALQAGQKRKFWAFLTRRQTRMLDLIVRPDAPALSKCRRSVRLHGKNQGLSQFIYSCDPLDQFRMMQGQPDD